MFDLYLAFLLVPLFAIVLASTYSSARQWTARRACYHRASLGSLVRGARRNAIVRHYGRA